MPCSSGTDAISFREHSGPGESHQSCSSLSGMRHASRCTPLPPLAGEETRRTLRPEPARADAKSRRARTWRSARSQHRSSSEPGPRTPARSRKRPQATTLSRDSTSWVASPSASCWSSVPSSVPQSVTKPRRPRARAEPSAPRQPQRMGQACQPPLSTHCQQLPAPAPLGPPSGAASPPAPPAPGSRSQKRKAPSSEAVTKRRSRRGWASATVTSAECAPWATLCRRYSPVSPRLHHLRTELCARSPWKRSRAGVRRLSQVMTCAALALKATCHSVHLYSGPPSMEWTQSPRFTSSVCGCSTPSALRNWARRPLEVIATPPSARGCRRRVRFSPASAPAGARGASIPWIHLG
mmetsp:Transcript_124682/g.364160  ORF Transcript_124682/g.364160 Transcript_124682/m.364160 type:complete len:352 (+) Transcript_124682:689-1744(+)